MTSTIAIIAPGAMGSAIAARLTANGIRVLTTLDGRSAATIARAKASRMEAATPDEIVAQSDAIFSVVPPAEALALAQQLAPTLASNTRKPIFIDWNAVSVETVSRIADVVAPTGAPFVDGAIIGSPPKLGSDGPTFHLSGADAARVPPLTPNLDMRVMDGTVGAASALKMSYAGITKGLTALGAAMVLAAARAGASDALRLELAASQPQLLARLEKALPDMFPKAYRWVAEMEEISAFVGDDRPEHRIYDAAAALYARLASDAGKDDVSVLAAFADKHG